MQGITLFHLQALNRLKKQQEEEQEQQLKHQQGPTNQSLKQQIEEKDIDTDDDDDISPIMSDSNTPLISNGMLNLALPSPSTGSSSANSNSNNSKNTNSSSNKGRLSASILSAYDLRNRAPPSYVSLTVGDKTVKTGPPAQRHKDRNSFKFAGGKNGDSANNEVAITDLPLQDLYRSTVTVQLVYENQPTQTLTADYKLNALKMDETTWLILTLERPAGTSASASSATATATADYSSVTSDDPDAAVDEETLPTLRLQMTLTGPYRTEIAALVNLCKLWFGAVDSAQGNIKGAVSKLPSLHLPDPKYLLVPAVPFVAIVVVSAPVLVGILVIGLPVFLPLAVVAFSIVSAVAVLAMAIYGSTEEGRSQIGGMLAPLAHTVLSTPSGQTLIYQTGPRPTPVKVARAILPTGIWQRLLISLLIDLIGSSSYLLPLVGEGTDLAWAPIQTILIMAMYDKTSPNLKYVSFMEEILPFTDIIPSATSGWLIQFGLPMVFANANANSNSNSQESANAYSNGGGMRIGVGNNNNNGGNDGTATPELPRN
jgi:hypothetical protein